MFDKVMFIIRQSVPPFDQQSGQFFCVHVSCFIHCPHFRWVLIETVQNRWGFRSTGARIQLSCVLCCFVFNDIDVDRYTKVRRH
jgi:hypothetical protein